jgi:ABC-type nitrate/sulfonate/bicarbonate transport system permease component
MMQPFVSILRSIPWFAWIAIVAIVCTTIKHLAQISMRHNERIAMIRMGMHPDLGVEKPHYEEQEV